MENDPESPQERIEKIERDLLVTMTAVRTFANEPPPDDKKTSAWGTFFEKVLLPLIPGLIMFGIGYLLIDSVKQDLEERKVQTTNAAQIQPLLNTLLGKEMPGAEEAKAAALSLAGFGRYSVIPLINVLESGGESRIAAAQKGLIAAGHIDKEYVCKVLIDAIDDRTQLYSWLSHKQLIDVIGRLNCISAIGAFSRYEVLLNKSPAEFRSVVDTEGVSDNDLPNKMTELQKTLYLARSRLRRD
jgi:hypothetical protein